MLMQAGLILYGAGFAVACLGLMEHRSRAVIGGGLAMMAGTMAFLMGG